MHRILQAEMRGKRRKVVGIMIHVVTVARLRGPAVATPVISDDAIAAMQEEHHLRVQSSADSGHPWLNTMG